MSSASEAEVQAGKKRIVEYYNELSGAWGEVWGEHIHNGFFDPGSTVSLSDQRSTQVRMIEEALRFASVSDDPIKKPKSIVDVGCGFGGSSRYLAKKYGAQCKGLSLSPGEIRKAKDLTPAEGLETKVSFEVGDALAMPFPDGQFDLVWCIGTSEHIADKRKDIKAEDWTQYAALFWPAMRRSVLSRNGLISLLTCDWNVIAEFLFASRFIKADKIGLAKFGVITCRKPA